MEKNYNIDDIENFLNQEMSPEELAAFEKEMATDNALSEEVTFHDDVVKGIQNAGVVDFRNLVSNVHQEMKKENFFDEKETIETTEKTVKKEATVRSISMFRRLAIAASFALLLAVGWWALNNQSPTPDQLFADNFKVHQDVLSGEVEDRLAETGFGNNKAQLTNLQAGINAYNVKDYSTAITIFENFEKAAPDDPLAGYATFYKAIALIETNQLTAAQENLQKSLNKANNPLINEVRWNLALVYLKQNNTTSAKTLLKALVTTDYQAQAEKILKDL